MSQTYDYIELSADGYLGYKDGSSVNSEGAESETPVADLMDLYTLVDGYINEKVVIVVNGANRAITDINCNYQLAIELKNLTSSYTLGNLNVGRLLTSQSAGHSLLLTNRAKVTVTGTLTIHTSSMNAPIGFLGPNKLHFDNGAKIVQKFVYDSGGENDQFMVLQNESITYSNHISPDTEVSTPLLSTYYEVNTRSIQGQSKNLGFLNYSNLTNEIGTEVELDLGGDSISVKDTNFNAGLAIVNNGDNTKTDLLVVDFIGCRFKRAGAGNVVRITNNSPVDPRQEMILDVTDNGNTFDLDDASQDFATGGVALIKGDMPRSLTPGENVITYVAGTNFHYALTAPAADGNNAQTHEDPGTTDNRTYRVDNYFWNGRLVLASQGSYKLEDFHLINHNVVFEINDNAEGSDIRFGSSSGDCVLDNGTSFSFEATGTPSDKEINIQLVSNMTTTGADSFLSFDDKFTYKLSGIVGFSDDTATTRILTVTGNRDQMIKRTGLTGNVVAKNLVRDASINFDLTRTVTGADLTISLADVAQEGAFSMMMGGEINSVPVKLTGNSGSSFTLNLNNATYKNMYYDLNNNSHQLVIQHGGYNGASDVNTDVVLENLHCGSCKVNVQGLKMTKSVHLNSGNLNNLIRLGTGAGRAKVEWDVEGEDLFKNNGSASSNLKFHLSGFKLYATSKLCSKDANQPTYQDSPALHMGTNATIDADSYELVPDDINEFTNDQYKIHITLCKLDSTFTVLFNGNADKYQFSNDQSTHTDWNDAFGNNTLKIKSYINTSVKILSNGENVSLANIVSGRASGLQASLELTSTDLDVQTVKVASTTYDTQKYLGYFSNIPNTLNTTEINIDSSSDGAAYLDLQNVDTQILSNHVDLSNNDKLYVQNQESQQMTVGVQDATLAQAHVYFFNNSESNQVSIKAKDLKINGAEITELQLIVDKVKACSDHAGLLSIDGYNSYYPFAIDLDDTTNVHIHNENATTTHYSYSTNYGVAQDGYGFQEEGTIVTEETLKNIPIRINLTRNNTTASQITFDGNFIVDSVEIPFNDESGNNRYAINSVGDGDLVILEDVEFGATRHGEPANSADRQNLFNGFNPLDGDNNLSGLLIHGKIKGNYSRFRLDSVENSDISFNYGTAPWIGAMRIVGTSAFTHSLIINNGSALTLRGEKLDVDLDDTIQTMYVENNIVLTGGMAANEDNFTNVSFAASEGGEIDIGDSADEVIITSAGTYLVGNTPTIKIDGTVNSLVAGDVKLRLKNSDNISVSAEDGTNEDVLTIQIDSTGELDNWTLTGLNRNYSLVKPSSGDGISDDSTLLESNNEISLTYNSITWSHGKGNSNYSTLTSDGEFHIKTGQLVKVRYLNADGTGINNINNLDTSKMFYAVFDTQANANAATKKNGSSLGNLSDESERGIGPFAIKLTQYVDFYVMTGLTDIVVRYGDNNVTILVEDTGPVAFDLDNANASGSKADKIYVDTDVALTNYDPTIPLHIDADRVVGFNNDELEGTADGTDLNLVVTNNATVSVRNAALKINGGEVARFNGTLDINDSSVTVEYASKHHLDNDDCIWNHLMGSPPKFSFDDDSSNKYDLSGGDFDQNEILGGASNSRGFILTKNVNTFTLPANLTERIVIKSEAESNTLTIDNFTVNGNNNKVTFDVYGKDLTINNTNLKGGSYLEFKTTTLVSSAKSLTVNNITQTGDRYGDLVTLTSNLRYYNFDINVTSINNVSGHTVKATSLNCDNSTFNVSGDGSTGCTKLPHVLLSNCSNFLGSNASKYTGNSDLLFAVGEFKQTILANGESGTNNAISDSNTTIFNALQMWKAQNGNQRVITAKMSGITTNGLAAANTYLQTTNSVYFAGGLGRTAATGGDFKYIVHEMNDDPGVSMQSLGSVMSNNDRHGIGAEYTLTLYTKVGNKSETLLSASKTIQDTTYNAVTSLNSYFGYGANAELDETVGRGLIIGSMDVVPLVEGDAQHPESTGVNQNENLFIDAYNFANSDNPAVFTPSLAQNVVQTNYYVPLSQVSNTENEEFNNHFSKTPIPAGKRWIRSTRGGTMNAHRVSDTITDLVSGLTNNDISDYFTLNVVTGSIDALLEPNDDPDSHGDDHHTPAEMISTSFLNFTAGSGCSGTAAHNAPGGVNDFEGEDGFIATGILPESQRVTINLNNISVAGTTLNECYVEADNWLQYQFVVTLGGELTSFTQTVTARNNTTQDSPVKNYKKLKTSGLFTGEEITSETHLVHFDIPMSYNSTVIKNAITNMTITVNVSFNNVDGNTQVFLDNATTQSVAFDNDMKTVALSNAGGSDQPLPSVVAHVANKVGVANAIKPELYKVIAVKVGKGLVSSDAVGNNPNSTWTINAVKNLNYNESNHSNEADKPQQLVSSVFQDMSDNIAVDLLVYSTWNAGFGLNWTPNANRPNSLFATNDKFLEQVDIKRQQARLADSWSGDVANQTIELSNMSTETAITFSEEYDDTNNHANTDREPLNIIRFKLKNNGSPGGIPHRDVIHGDVSGVINVLCNYAEHTYRYHNVDFKLSHDEPSQHDISFALVYTDATGVNAIPPISEVTHSSKALDTSDYHKYQLDTISKSEGTVNNTQVAGSNVNLIFKSNAPFNNDVTFRAYNKTKNGNYGNALSVWGGTDATLHTADVNSGNYPHNLEKTLVLNDLFEDETIEKVKITMAISDKSDYEANEEAVAAANAEIEAANANIEAANANILEQRSGNAGAVRPSRVANDDGSYSYSIQHMLEDQTGYGTYSIGEYVLEASNGTAFADKTYFKSNGTFAFAEVRDPDLNVGDQVPGEKITQMNRDSYLVYAYVPKHTGDGAAPARAGYRYAVVNTSNNEIMAFMNSPATRATETPLETNTASQTTVGEYNHLQTAGGNEVDIIELTRDNSIALLEAQVVSLRNGWTLFSRVNDDGGENNGKSQLVFAHNGIEQSVLTTTN